MAVLRYPSGNPQASELEVANDAQLAHLARQIVSQLRVEADGVWISVQGPEHGGAPRYRLAWIPRGVPLEFLFDEEQQALERELGAIVP